MNSNALLAKTKQKLLERTPLFLKYLLIGIAALFILSYLYIALSRITYPYELEWMEGGIADHVRQLLAGKQLFGKPSLDFTPYIYTPLYYYVSAAICKLTDMGLPPLRMVSFYSSLGCLLFIFLFVRRETKNLLCAFLSSALFLATFGLTGAWFDIARVDSLFLFFLLGGVYFLRYDKSFTASLLAGLLIFMSFFTKQIALVVAIFLSLYCLIAFHKWNKLTFIFLFLGLLGLSTWYFNSTSDGWYGYYIFDLPRQHALDFSKLLTYWSKDVSQHLAIGFGLSLFYLLHISKNRKNDFSYYLLFFIGMVFASWFARLHSGGFVNGLFPIYAAISIFFGLGVYSLLDYAKKGVKNLPKIKKWECGIYLACIIQFLLLTYNPWDQIPTKADRQAGNGFVQILKNIEGEVFIRDHGYLSSLAGKKTYAHAMAITDILRGSDEKIKTDFGAEMRSALLNKKFEAIILDGFYWKYGDELVKNYEYKGLIFRDYDVFWARTEIQDLDAFISPTGVLDPKAFLTRSSFRTRPNYYFGLKESKETK